MSKTTSVYQFAHEVGKLPQYLYALRREGKMPENLFVAGPDGKINRLKLDEAREWWANREATKGHRPIQVAPSDPKMYLELLVGWLEQAPGQKKLAGDLKKVLAAMQENQEGGETE